MCPRTPLQVEFLPKKSGNKQTQRAIALGNMIIPTINHVEEFLHESTNEDVLSD
jgi:hypothetical protein